MGRSKAEKKGRREKRRKARRIRRILIGVAVLIAVIGVPLYMWTAPPLPQAGDHWHATLEIEICGKREPPLPRSPGGIHAHGDDHRIHIHPSSRAESGTRSNLGRFFDGQRLRFTASMIELPGGRFYKEGDPCPDGTAGNLVVRVNGGKIDDPRAYIPRDSDRIQIRFGT
ncbi:MAG: hypothetical protein ACE5K9_07150 [Candidatus Methylomirabilales bacterium]